MEEQYKIAHKSSSKHRQAIEASTTVGCFSCRQLYNSTEIEDWIDRESTALCPACGTDAVLPESKDYRLNDEFLTGMRKAWFGY